MQPSKNGTLNLQFFMKPIVKTKCLLMGRRNNCTLYSIPLRYTSKILRGDFRFIRSHYNHIDNFTLLHVQCSYDNVCLHLHFSSMCHHPPCAKILELNPWLKFSNPYSIDGLQGSYMCKTCTFEEFVLRFFFWAHLWKWLLLLQH
jgi:hypothetical protein